MNHQPTKAEENDRTSPEYPLILLRSLIVKSATYSHLRLLILVQLPLAKTHPLDHPYRLPTNPQRIRNSV